MTRVVPFERRRLCLIHESLSLSLSFSLEFRASRLHQVKTAWPLNGEVTQCLVVAVSSLCLSLVKWHRHKSLGLGKRERKKRGQEPGEMWEQRHGLQGKTSPCHTWFLLPPWVQVPRPMRASKLDLILLTRPSLSLSLSLCLTVGFTKHSACRWQVVSQSLRLSPRRTPARAVSPLLSSYSLMEEYDGRRCN
ncbi:hypothetical protein LY76DRAFT_283168 [Colletotrichum caudatum]|nr:hypothetical protein LY76DRAFT_283168 [Colletotrichum caudatum]